MLRIPAVAVVIAVLASPVAAEEVDYRKAIAAAAEANRDVIIEFTGSDWCPPCKVFKQKVLDDVVFAKAAADYVHISLDFPNDKSRQSEAEIALNRQLQKRFEVSAFPTVVIIDTTGRPYGRWVGYDGGTAADYAQRLADLRQVRLTRDAAFAAAATATGLERARLLDKGLRGIDPELIASVYRPEAATIIAADADGKAGLKARYEPLILAPMLLSALEQIKHEPGDVATRLKKIDELAARLKPTGASLQQVHYTKAVIVYIAGPREAAREHFEAALQAAPATRRADEIRKIIARHYSGDRGGQPVSEQKSR